MNTMADTSCAGKNCTPIYFTGDTVDVAPFALEQYESMKQILVATCATIITTQIGRVYRYRGNGLQSSFSIVCCGLELLLTANVLEEDKSRDFRNWNVAFAPSTPKKQ